MAQQGLIARAGKGLLDFFVLLLRGTGALCAAFGSILLFAFHNEKANAEEPSDSTDRIVGQDEAEQYGWDSW